MQRRNEMITLYIPTAPDAGRGGGLGHGGERGYCTTGIERKHSPRIRYIADCMLVADLTITMQHSGKTYQSFDKIKIVSVRHD